MDIGLKRWPGVLRKTLQSLLYGDVGSHRHTIGSLNLERQCPMNRWENAESEVEVKVTATKGDIDAGPWQDSSAGRSKPRPYKNVKAAERTFRRRGNLFGLGRVAR